MPVLDPLPRSDLPGFEAIFAMVETSMGFVPSSMFTMARNPQLVEAFGGLSLAVMAAPLEERRASVAESLLAGRGWSPGKHIAGSTSATGGIEFGDTRMVEE